MQDKKRHLGRKGITPDVIPGRRQRVRPTAGPMASNPESRDSGSGLVKTAGAVWTKPSRN